MKPFLITLSIFCALEQSSAQNVLWERHYSNGLATPQKGFKTIEGADGAIYGTGMVGGWSMAFGDTVVDITDFRDIFLGKWDSSGALQWVRSIGGSSIPTNWEEGERIVYDPVMDRVIISGQYNSTIDFGPDVLPGNGSQIDLFTASFDTQGNCIWARGITGNSVFGKEILVDAAGNVQCIWGSSGTGHFEDPPSVYVGSGAYVTTYDPTGNRTRTVLLAQNAGFASAAWMGTTDWFLLGEANPNGTVCGQAIGTIGFRSGFIAKADTTGQLDWLEVIEGDSATGVYDLVVSGQHIVFTGCYYNRLVFAGDTLVEESSLTGGFIASMSLTGDPEWIQPIETYYGTMMAYNKMCVGPDGSIYCMGVSSGPTTIGQTEFTPGSSTDVFIARFDTLGNCIGLRHYGQASVGYTGSVLATASGLYLSFPYESTFTIGNTTIPVAVSGHPDLFIAKLDELSGISAVESFGTLDNALHIYANPNKGTCTIDLPAALQLTDDLQLTIVDQTGQVVQRMPLRYTPEGVAIDIRAQAKGIYHVELGDGRQRYTGTIVFE